MILCELLDWMGSYCRLRDRSIALASGDQLRVRMDTVNYRV